jgi:hypothetical protein
MRACAPLAAGAAIAACAAARPSPSTICAIVAAVTAPHPHLHPTIHAIAPATRALRGAALFHATRPAAAPTRVVIADDTMTADTAFRLASEGVGLLWRSDFQNARQLLQALMRRVDKPRKPKRKQAEPDTTPGAAFHRHRQIQAQRARHDVARERCMHTSPCCVSHAISAPLQGPFFSV